MSYETKFLCQHKFIETIETLLSKCDIILNKLAKNKLNLSVVVECLLPRRGTNVV